VASVERKLDYFDLLGPPADVDFKFGAWFYVVCVDDCHGDRMPEGRGRDTAGNGPNSLTGAGPEHGMSGSRCAPPDTSQTDQTASAVDVTGF